MKFSTKAYLIASLILIQTIIIMLFSHQMFADRLGVFVIQYPFSISAIIGFLGIVSIFLIGSIFRFVHIERQAITDLNHSQEVIAALRAQKHDFKNHLNLLGGMIKLGKTDKALEYIFNISEQVDEAFAISKIENVELAAILYQKSAIAENKGITVEIDISSDLADLDIDSITLSKIAFNLLDNAIYELDSAQVQDKTLSVDAAEFEDCYMLAVGNSYPVLPKEMQQHIFERGYTTKEGEGHGYGLHIVKRLVEKYNGKISVESSEEIGTQFTIYLPRKKHTHIAS
jgi:sensor histidine kinase regulating citrate/malate metabolism